VKKEHNILVVDDLERTRIVRPLGYLEMIQRHRDKKKSEDFPTYLGAKLKLETMALKEGKFMNINKSSICLAREGQDINYGGPRVREITIRRIPLRSFC
jgi:hypothetical protein